MTFNTPLPDLLIPPSQMSTIVIAYNDYDAYIGDVSLNPVIWHKLINRTEAIAINHKLHSDQFMRYWDKQGKYIKRLVERLEQANA